MASPALERLTQCAQQDGPQWDMDGTWMEHLLNITWKLRIETHTHNHSHIHIYIIWFYDVHSCSHRFCQGALRTLCSADSDVPGTALQEQTAWRSEWSGRSSGRPGARAAPVSVAADIYGEQIRGETGWCPAPGELRFTTAIGIHGNPLGSTIWSSWGQCDHLGIHAGIPSEHQRTSEKIRECYSQCFLMPSSKDTQRQSKADVFQCQLHRMELYNNYLVDLLRPIDWQGEALSIT